MKHFCAHNLCSSSTASQPPATEIERQYDFIPSLYGEMTKPSVCLNAYPALTESFENSSLTPQERQIILLTVRFENGQQNNASQEFKLPEENSLPDDILDAINEDRPIQSEKLQALRHITSEIVGRKGWVSNDMIVSFITAGYSKQSLKDVLTGIGLQTLLEHQERKVNRTTDVEILNSPNLKIV